MSEASKKKRDALPPNERAGFKLDRDRSYPVLQKDPRDPRKSVAMGWIDPELHIYQGGGELREIVFLPAQLLSWPIEVFEAMERGGVWTIEMLDHDSNTAYRISLKSAQNHGRQYDTARGPRWGVHLRWVEHVNANEGIVVEHGNRIINPLQERMDL